MFFFLVLFFFYFCHYIGTLKNEWSDKISFVFDVGRDNPRPTGISTICKGCRGFYEEEDAKQFIGALSKPQKQLIRDWAETVGSNQSEWAQSRSSWMDGFQSALAVRAEPGFERAIEQLFVDADSFWSSDYQQRYAANTAHGIELVIALQQTLTAKQQKKLRRELLDWADNFSELAEEKQQLALAVP